MGRGWRGVLPGGSRDHLLGTKVSNVTLLARAKSWARSIKRDVVVLWLAARDPRVPWYAKAVAAAVAGYALSPIDLIPDFIPVLGYFDDLLILPVGILLAIKLIPARIIDELRVKALDQQTPKSIAGLITIVIVWVIAITVTAWLIWPSAANARH